MLDCITPKDKLLSGTLLTFDKLFSENKNSWIGCISAILKFPQIKPHNVLTNQKLKQKYHTTETTGQSHRQSHRQQSHRQSHRQSIDNHIDNQ